MKFIILLVLLFMSLANPISGGKMFGGFGKNPDKWMKQMIRKLQRKTNAYGHMIASNTAAISNNVGFISSIASCDFGYINDPDYGLQCCFEDMNNLGHCLCNGTTIDDISNPGRCCFASLKHPDHCLCSGTDMDDPTNPGNCCFQDSSNPGQCLCNAANYTDDQNKRCFNLNWKGDGICDDKNNHGGCDFDGGDCCGKDVDKDLCTLCQCLEEEAPLQNAVGCCFEDSNNPGQCICTGADIDDPDNAGSCCVEDQDSPGNCCVDSITCNGQGTCSSGSSGICACDSGFTGDRCNITTCPGTPICSNSGNCPEGGTVCECQAGFYDDDCAVFCDATATCSDQGTCGIDGICQCVEEKQGVDCSEDKPPPLPNGLILLTTGRLNGADSAASQVVNILDSSSTCQNIPDYPVAVHLAGGGIVDNVPIVCGGYSDDHGRQADCYKLDRDTIQWTLLTDALPVNYRLYATPYNGTLFISGGRGEVPEVGSADKAETLFLSLDGSFRYGPDLPTTRRDHCSVELHDGRAIIMGSDKWTHSDANTVLFYDPIADDFVDGPPMNSDRTELACTLFHSPMHDNRPVVLALGGYAGVTAEILDYSVVGKGWEYIGDLPSAFNTGAGAGAFAMTSKDGQGAYVQHGTNLFELTCTANDCTWTTMPTKFSNDLKYGVAMHLTEDWDGLCS